MKHESTTQRWLYKIANLLISDKLYTQLKFYRSFGRFPDFKNPKTFNEKLCYLKVFRHNPAYTTMVDKVAAKDYVANIIGSEYIIPTLGVWERAQDIDFETLPDKFVMKGSHDSGRVVVCSDKSRLDREATRREMADSLKRDFYAITREWPYKNVPHRILAEKFIRQSDGGLNDYKFFCFNGKVDCVMVCLDRHLNDPKFYFFDRDWNFLRLNKRGIAAAEDFTLPKPENMDAMFDMAEKLSQHLPFVRVDLYNVDGKIYFGELTFFPDGGVDHNLLPETDLYWGNLLNL